MLDVCYKYVAVAMTLRGFRDANKEEKKEEEVEEEEESGLTC